MRDTLRSCNWPPQIVKRVHLSCGKHQNQKFCADAVYQVCVGRFPRCSCPDFAKGNICKHYLVRDIGLRPSTQVA